VGGWICTLRFVFMPLKATAGRGACRGRHRRAPIIAAGTALRTSSHCHFPHPCAPQCRAALRYGRTRRGMPGQTSQKSTGYTGIPGSACTHSPMGRLGASVYSELQSMCCFASQQHAPGCKHARLQARDAQELHKHFMVLVGPATRRRRLAEGRRATEARGFRSGEASQTTGKA
jgi:hypothetical protein